MFIAGAERATLATGQTNLHSHRQVTTSLLIELLSHLATRLHAIFTPLTKDYGTLVVVEELHTILSFRRAYSPIVSRRKIQCETECYFAPFKQRTALLIGIRSDILVLLFHSSRPRRIVKRVAMCLKIWKDICIEICREWYIYDYKRDA